MKIFINERIMKRIKTLLILLLCTATNSFAQISESGIPPSFYNTTLRNKVSMESMPSVNVDFLIQADELEKGMVKPFRFGYALNVNLNLENSGTWETLENGDKIWRLKIFSKGAYSINLIFDNFWLPEKSQFFVSNEEQDMILGAFTVCCTPFSSKNRFISVLNQKTENPCTRLEYIDNALITNKKDSHF
jgi:hypothetical protein